VLVLLDKQDRYGYELVEKMTEQQFLSELELALTRLPTDESNDILSDIKEYFTNGREDGNTGSDIVTSLGTPKEIAEEIMDES
jgi:uncharacterized membrane protein